MTDTLAVVEAFGPTIQGEGPAAGRLAWFVRLGGCNLSCSWCDTPYTWDRTRYRMRDQITATTVDDVLDPIPANALVVITGGEPLLQQHRPAWGQLLRTLWHRGSEVHVETNGTLEPSASTVDLVQLFAVSPKLPNAGGHQPRQDPTLHRGWSTIARQGRAHLKVVCAGADDVARTARMAADYGWPLRQVWVMPQGTTAEELAATWTDVAEAATAWQLNATHRLHVLAWGDERGR